MVDMSERENGLYGKERGDRADTEFGVKFSLREIRRIFPLKYAIPSLGKCLNY